MSLLFISSLSSSAGSAMLLLGQSHNTCDCRLKKGLRNLSALDGRCAEPEDLTRIE